MKILYYCWNEYTSLDIMDVFKRKKYQFDCFAEPVHNKLADEQFMRKLNDKLKSDSYDCIFSFNFFPVISKVADKCGIKYISWIFDSPCLTLYSDSVFNTCNYIFLFDRMETIRFKNLGLKNVYHMPLGVNTIRLNNMLTKDISKTKYEYDVSFVGNLYNNEYNFYDQIKNMPEYYKGFFDGIIDSQMEIFGYDLASDIITEKFEPILNTFVNFNLDKEVFFKNTDAFIQILQKKMTVVERPAILQLISEFGFSVAHFAVAPDERLKKVSYKGYVDYDKEMPVVFRKSKINLNISLRSILSGIPLRCMDIMGAGGFLLSNYQPELAEFFVADEEAVMYASREDMVNKIKYYLEHEDERMAIAEKGRVKVENEYSYDVLIERILELSNVK